VIDILKNERIGKAEDYKLIAQGKDFNLEIKPQSINFVSVYMEDGRHINSGFLGGLYKEEAIGKMHNWLGKEGIGGPAIYYHLRDWLISRQRYWGAPIPMVFCQKCASAGGSAQAGWQPVPEKDLPVLLPDIKDFRPTGEAPKESPWLPTGQGNSPLAKSKEFVETTCPKCKNPAQRETDTMDTFVCSSWYYFRYTDPQNDKKFASREKIRDWLPVNMYIGGAEHTVLHLLYSRFFTKALRDMGYLDFDEPFSALRHQGIILGEDGQKMSKSRGNVVDPDEQIKKYGSDVIRMYLCFMGPYNQGGPWNPKGIVGIDRFLKKFCHLFENQKLDAKNQMLNNDKDLERLLNKTIKKVTEDIENLKLNTAISALMILVNEISKLPKLQTTNYRLLLLLLAPFAPHLTEELYQKYFIQDTKYKIQNSVHNQPWPKYDEKLIKEETIQLIIQINGRVRDQIEVEANIQEEKAKELALSQEKIQKLIGGKEIKKIIFVPGRLINIVI
jgi:leucyl-tRNA synthetase